jgi:AraC-like DNA-binding protein
MNIKTYAPKHPGLKKYIHFFYEVVFDHVSYTAYPHYAVCVAFLEGARSTIYESGVRIEEAPDAGVLTLTFNMYHRELDINIQGRFREFAISFTSFGLAQFTRDSLDLSKTSPGTKILYCFDDFFAAHPGFFDTPIHQKITQIEAYLMSRLSERKHTGLVANCLGSMHNELPLPDITGIISKKTLSRAFKNNCGVSMSVLLKVIRFRNAIARLRDKEDKARIAQIAYDCGFYDQAHFNGTFKAFTNEVPKRFLETVTDISEQHIHFKITQ